MGFFCCTPSIYQFLKAQHSTGNNDKNNAKSTMHLQGLNLLAAEQDRVAAASASGRKTLDETIMNDYQRTQEEARARTSKAATDLESLRVAQVCRCGSSRDWG